MPQDPDEQNLPGLAPTPEEAKHRANKAFKDFAEKEWRCGLPSCAGGTTEKTVVWDDSTQKAKCYRCGWEDTRQTEKGRRLEKAAR